MTAYGGEVVKRLGDGMMAVFDEPSAALDALGEACAGVREVEVAGYRPRFRAGLHVGRPRRIGGDYLGVDVNVAARVAEEAEGEEVLVSDRALEHLDAEKLDLRRKRQYQSDVFFTGSTHRRGNGEFYHQRRHKWHDQQNRSNRSVGRFHQSRHVLQWL